MSFEKMNTDKVLVSFTFFAPWRHLSGLCPSDADKEWLNIAAISRCFNCAGRAVICLLNVIFVR